MKSKYFIHHRSSPIARKEIFPRQLWFPPRLEIKELSEEEDEWSANPCHTLLLLVLLKTWKLLGSKQPVVEVESEAIELRKQYWEIHVYL